MQSVALTLPSNQLFVVMRHVPSRDYRVWNFRASTSLASHKGERTEQIQTASGKPSSSHGTGNGFCSLSCSDVTWVRRILWYQWYHIGRWLSWEKHMETDHLSPGKECICHENDHAKDAEWYWVSCVNHQRRYPAVWLWICEGAASLEGTLTYWHQQCSTHTLRCSHNFTYFTEPNLHCTFRPDSQQQRSHYHFFRRTIR